MIVCTSDTIAGKKIVRTLGMVRGNTIRARHLGKDVMAVLRNLVGGEVSEYTKMMAEAREQADLELIAGFLVDMRSTQNGELLDLVRQRDGSAHLGAGPLGRVDDSIDPQVGLGRGRRSDVHGLVGKANVERRAVGIRIDGHGADAHFATGAHDAQGNFAPVCNENFFKHIVSPEAYRFSLGPSKPGALDLL